MARGVTRTVVVGRHYAVKVPSVRHRYVIRGWLANRSEWKQRRRLDIVRPVLTLGHLALVYPTADGLMSEREWSLQRHVLIRDGYSHEEAKASSWGRFGGRWLLLDFDRAWQPPLGIIGGLYFGHEERLAARSYETHYERENQPSPSSGVDVAAACRAA